MKVLVSEVGPRDGLQSISTIMPTEAKKRWITALAAAGVQEIEVGSFVDPGRAQHPLRGRGAGADQHPHEGRRGGRCGRGAQADDSRVMQRDS